ncbi:uncharacterized protein F5Z01DRAFT_654359 [Emericellopsis atlantica]|uniref:Oxidoreductase acuF-like C2H2 type zinc-finger domain-containing protein n=1 Tax=Emericellopsis atlantica TaxID=2614577 RepID=A0A9P7ZM90_9HYPO|nr:uncharacterized protein F5Z01DRAFT_654359 [Emericellopsis atlantica]KAG9254620.1 hypothetical protein F5Z01DRAFT_654359 [Emericellopsis atlantica]
MGRSDNTKGQRVQQLRATSSTKSQEASTFEDSAQASLAAFGHLCRVLPDTLFASLTSILLDERSRFRLWAGKFSALPQGRSKEDISASEPGQPDLQDVSLFALQRLSVSLQRASEIVEHKRPNRCNNTLQDASPAALAELTSEIVKSELHNSNHEKGLLSMRSTTTELAEVLLGAHSAITHLLQISSLACSSLSEYATEPGMSRGTYEVDGRPDITHMTDKFPLLKQRPWLAERLGNLVAQRRAHIRYQQNYRGQNNADFDVPVSVIHSDAVSVAHSEGMPTDSGYGSQRAASIRTFDSDATSFASTAKSSGGTAGHIPSLTSMRLDGKRLEYNVQIECPYCRTPQIFRNKQMWKQHVYSDLSFYVCTFPECSEPAFATSHDWFHHELSQHRKQWQCHLCDVCCVSADNMGAHFDADHQRDILDSQRTDLVGLCEMPIQHFPDDSCPFCENWNPSGTPYSASRKRFRSHLGGHLREIAREAIPLAIEGLEVVEEEEEDDDSSSSDETSSSLSSSDDEHSQGDQGEPVSNLDPGDGISLEKGKKPSQSPSVPEHATRFVGQKPMETMDGSAEDLHRRHDLSTEPRITVYAQSAEQASMQQTQQHSDDQTSIYSQVSETVSQSPEETMKPEHQNVAKSSPGGAKDKEEPPTLTLNLYDHYEVKVNEDGTSEMVVHGQKR